MQYISKWYQKIGEEYEIWIPLNRRIYSVIKLLIDGINELTNGQFQPKKLPMLYNKETTETYDINLTVSDADIGDGTQLILM